MRKHFLKNFAVILLSLLLVNPCWAGIDFDGVDDYVQVTDFLSTDQSGLSVSAWVYFDTSNTDDFIIRYGNTGTTDGISLHRDDVGGVSGRTDCFKVATVNAIVTMAIEGATNSAPSGQWIHICVTFYYSSLKLYVNGVEDPNSPNNTAAGAIVNPALDCFVGAISATASNSVADGKITEFALWTETLTATEVKLLASSRLKGIPLQIQPSALKLYLPMDDQETGTAANGDTVRDLSGNGNNGAGNDGANNAGLTWTQETVLSYPSRILGAN